MRYIEQGIDKYGVTCWYVLDDAELIGLTCNGESINVLQRLNGKIKCMKCWKDTRLMLYYH